jgi:hypothetical protein
MFCNSVMNMFVCSFVLFHLDPNVAQNLMRIFIAATHDTRDIHDVGTNPEHHQK